MGRKSVFIAGILFGAILMPGGARATAPVEAATRARDENFLNLLAGNWDMRGELGGKPAHYCAVGRRILANGWLEFHLRDLASAPAYEAAIFISEDKAAQDYILHWLDQFGAAGARVVGRGTRTGNSLKVTFPYAEGAFRNDWEFHPADRSWTLLIEGQSKDGRWSKFASYTMRRARRGGKASCSSQHLAK